MIENRKSSIVEVLLQFDVLGNKDEFVRGMKPFAGVEDFVNWWALLCRLAASLEPPGDSESRGYVLRF